MTTLSKPTTSAGSARSAESMDATVRAAIPTLQATSAVLLPGMKHARALLDVSIRVLEYFHQHAANDSAMGQFTAPQKAEPNLIEEAERVKALLSAFGRLNEKNH